MLFTWDICNICNRRVRLYAAFTPPNANHSLWICRTCAQALKTWTKNLNIPESEEK